MKTKYYSIIVILMLLEGILDAISLGLMSFDPGRGERLNYQVLRWVLEILIFIVLGGIGFLLAFLLKKSGIAIRMMETLESSLVGKKRLFLIQPILLIAAVFFTECYLLTYLAFPVPLRPIFIWITLICLQTWLFLRLMYTSVYRERSSQRKSLKTRWLEWSPAQRKTLKILAVIGLLYFLAFIPLNFLRDKETHFYSNPDENTIYPDVTRVLIGQGSYEATLHNVLDAWQWWYGYPYLPISAAVLVIPRLILGPTFAEHFQLNIFLLRQFVSVLPMILALLLLVYLVTRFEHTLFASGMFIFLLLIPGIIRFNFHFWHPDGIILLLILLTFYFLEKDQLNYKLNFYLAALTCALALAIKLWGAFFFLTIAGYLIAGLISKKLTFWLMVWKGLAFLLVMAGTIAITSPTLMAPYVTKSALEGWKAQQGWLLSGYAEPDPEGVYRTGLSTWLRFFDMYYMKNYVFFIAGAALIAGSLWGARKYLNRIILPWCVATGIFLVAFVSMKANQYMIPLMIPLYAGVFLMPWIGLPADSQKTMNPFLKPLWVKLLWMVFIAVVGSQFIFNLITIITSHAVGINDFFVNLR